MKNNTETLPSSPLLAGVRQLHSHLVFGRRTRVLAELVGERTTHQSRVLDVGCGDGTVATLVKSRDISLDVHGLEISARPKCSIEYKLFDGVRIPHPDESFDVCVFIDVLHHVEDPLPLLREAVRVSRRNVLIKDHLCESRFDWWTLRFMDWMGNRPHGVAMTYSYKSRMEWKTIFDHCQLDIVSWSETLNLYAFPLSAFFGRRLHMITLLEKRIATSP